LAHAHSEREAGRVSSVEDVTATSAVQNFSRDPVGSDFVVFAVYDVDEADEGQKS
jgi:hypothetical protein